MSTFPRLSFLRCLALASGLGLSCSGDEGGTKQGPCARDGVAGCGATCDVNTSCAPGLYCENGSCTAECTAASASTDCDEGQRCDDDGRCGAGDGDAADGTGDAADGTGDGDGQGDGQGDGDVCASIELEPMPVVPNVMFIIDRSGSMRVGFDTTTRWQALKDVLLAGDGLIATLQDRVNFGVALYAGRPANNTTDVCPNLASVDVAMNNLAGIQAVYQPAEPLTGTPTGESIESVLASPGVQGLLSGPNPTIFVLATDGEPDTCADPDANDLNATRARSVAALDAAFAAGVRTYVIAVANENELAQDHVQALANAGVGMAGATSYRVSSVAALESDLTNIVSGALSCEVPLQGTFTGDDPCVGDVKLNGSSLECNGPDGWHLVGDSTLVIDGAACDTLKAGGTLSAEFPCGTAVPL